MDEEDRYAKPKVSTTEDAYGLMTASPKKHNNQDTPSTIKSPLPKKPASEQPKTSSSMSSIVTPPTRPSSSPLQNQKPLKSALKKVTMSDLLKRSASELQINTNLSNTGISISEANQQLGAFSPAVIASHRQPKLRFNQYVEQCIALSSNDNSKKRNSRVRMAELNHVSDDQESEQDEDTTASDDYEPGEDSDAGSVIMMRRNNSRPRSSIKKIEPALLKTNSRSENDDSVNSDSSSDDENKLIPALSSSSHRHHHRRHSHSKAPSNSTETWDAESAESDAFVKHIIRVSKGKQPAGPRDPALDRMAVEPPLDDWEDQTNGDTMQAKSDYDYEFDDDDWDTHSEHAEDNPFNISTSKEYLPVAPPLPVGCKILKAPTNQAVLPDESPVVETSSNDMQYQQPQHETNANSSDSDINSSLFSNIAHWASSHLWPADRSTTNVRKQ
jgi:hypothetical protein